MGGDRAPDEIVAGALDAAADGDRVVLFGPAGLDTGGLELVEAPDVIGMHEKPAEAVRAKPDSSLVAAHLAVAEGARTPSSRRGTPARCSPRGCSTCAGSPG